MFFVVSFHHLYGSNNKKQELGVFQDPAFSLEKSPTRKRIMKKFTDSETKDRKARKVTDRETIQNKIVIRFLVSEEKPLPRDQF